MDDEQPVGGDVIAFPRSWHRAGNQMEAALDELTVRSERSASPCQHRRSTLDSQARRLYCRDCRVELDPITVLGALVAHRESELRDAVYTRRELERMEREVADLRRQEKNAKSRIRTARKRRDDQAALAAAAASFRSEAGVSLGIGGYRGWDSLSGPQREVVVGYVRQIVEAYAGALEAEESAPDVGAA